MSYKHALCWIRRDLRLNDHQALAEATRNSDQVTVFFVFDRSILAELKNKHDRRLTFIAQTLKGLECELREKASSLIVRYGDPIEEVPILASLLNADAVFTNHDYEPAAIKRDQQVEQALQSKGVDFLHFKDQVIFEKDEILNKSGEPFKVFTPYKKAWLANFVAEKHAMNESPNLHKLTQASVLEKHTWNWDLESLGFHETPLWLKAGRLGGLERLQSFAPALKRYKDERDFPALSSTSGLSVHLRFGTVSIRELVREAIKQRSLGAQTWLSELIWREFYQMLLAQHPRLEHEAFRAEYNGIQWPGVEEHFEAWKVGQTGFPLVDAAMRHFNATGWMHNRLRMVTATFLVKDLLIDWRAGEKYFADNLLDFDFAANNGGWQWCASTGCDAQPYFRIFNPITQSEKFDPNGDFIRANVPELRGFSNKHIHNPSQAPLHEQQRAGCIVGKDYPETIVEHGIQRILALALYSKYQNKKAKSP